MSIERAPGIRAHVARAAGALLRVRIPNAEWSPLPSTGRTSKPAPAVWRVATRNQLLTRTLTLTPDRLVGPRAPEFAERPSEPVHRRGRRLLAGTARRPSARLCPRFAWELPSVAVRTDADNLLEDDEPDALRRDSFHGRPSLSQIITDGSR